MFALYQRAKTGTIRWVGVAKDVRTARELGRAASRELVGVVECVFNKPDGTTVVCCTFESGLMISKADIDGTGGPSDPTMPPPTDPAGRGPTEETQGS